jgi:ribonuclease P protein component
MKYNRDFKRLYLKGKSVCGGYLVMYYRKANVDHNILGITATKKLGKAVIRNRTKRLIRESYRLKEDFVSPGYYIVFVARNKAVGASFEKISHDMSFLLKKSGIIPPTEE